MIDIKLFNDLFVKGLSRVIQVTPENIVVAYKQYDMEQAKLGVLVAMPEQVMVQTKKELTDELTQLQSRVAAIQAFLLVK